VTRSPFFHPLNPAGQKKYYSPAADLYQGFFPKTPGIFALIPLPVPLIYESFH
jgi:hypothetical protein